MRIKKGNKLPTLRSLKQGTKFYGGDNVICIAGTKRGESREYSIPGRPDTFFMRSDNTVQVVRTTLK